MNELNQAKKKASKFFKMDNLDSVAQKVTDFAKTQMQQQLNLRKDWQENTQLPTIGSHSQPKLQENDMHVINMAETHPERYLSNGPNPSTTNLVQQNGKLLQ